jgi:hypothetical protein
MEPQFEDQEYDNVMYDHVYNTPQDASSANLILLCFYLH